MWGPFALRGKHVGEWKRTQVWANVMLGGRGTGFAGGARKPQQQRSMLVVRVILSEAPLRHVCAFTPRPSIMSTVPSRDSVFGLGSQFCDVFEFLCCNSRQVFDTSLMWNAIVAQETDRSPLEEYFSGTPADYSRGIGKNRRSHFDSWIRFYLGRTRCTYILSV